MKDVTEYVIVQSNRETYNSFEKEVMMMINEGWQPLGGVSNSFGGGYTQAMVKYN